MALLDILGYSRVECLIYSDASGQALCPFHDNNLELNWRRVHGFHGKRHWPLHVRAAATIFGISFRTCSIGAADKNRTYGIRGDYLCNPTNLNISTAAVCF